MATITITDDETKLVQEAEIEYKCASAVEPLLRMLQRKHAVWEATKLPEGADRSISTMAHGICEEGCWELIDAINNGNQDESADALGDVLVYACALCTKLELDFNTLARGFDVADIEQPTMDAILILVKTTGQIHHIVGKQRQGTRGYDDEKKVRLHLGATISRLLAIVNWMCFANEWDATALFETVVTQVMQRDWSKNAVTGGTGNQQLTMSTETI